MAGFFGAAVTLKLTGIADFFELFPVFHVLVMINVPFINSERTPLPLNHLTRLTESEGGGMNLMCFFKENISPLNA